MGGILEDIRDILTVGPLQCGGQAQGEFRCEVGQDLLVCIGGDVVRWALEAGFASLEHANLIEEDIPLFLKTGAYISDPNLILFFDPVRGFETPTNKTHKWEDLPEWWHEKVRRSREQTRRVMSKALKAGVKFALGTDLNHTLLWLECKYFIEEIGATNMQALFAVTRDSAELLGLADEIGTLE